jgi:predicted PurR-regulated permease PerM
VVPLFVVVGLITNEVNVFYRDFLSNGDFFHKYLDGFVSSLEKISILGIFDLKSAFSESELMGPFKSLSGEILVLIERIYQGMAGFILWIFAMFFSLYYFLIDGERVVKKILYLSPLKDEHEKIIIQRFTSIVRAVTKGVLIIGVIQSTIGGLAFAIAGVPSPVIWGIMMFFFSLIPMVGTSLIWFPVGLILLLGGGTWEGIFILSVGLFIISTVDNLIRPKLVGRDTQIHPLLIFFATLGGFMVFGPTGFILGPVIVALALSFWNIYASEFKDDLRSFNA